MLLAEQRNRTRFFVRHADATAVTLADRKLTTSFLLGAETLVEGFPARDAAELSPAAMQSVLALNAEVVLLGSGVRARFPSQAVLGEFLSRGIGLETMDNAAAARTFNVLVGEGRRAVALFLLPG